jgi:hypothetical protein
MSANRSDRAAVSHSTHRLTVTTENSLTSLAKFRRSEYARSDNYNRARRFRPIPDIQPAHFSVIDEMAAEL